MPKMKTRRGCRETFLRDRNRKAQEDESVQKAHLNEEIPEDQEKLKKIYDHGSDQFQGHEKDPAVSVKKGGV
jgi:ribosomal protein L35